MRENAIAPAGDLEVRLGHASEIHTLEVRGPERRIGHGHEVPRDPGPRHALRDHVHGRQIDRRRDRLIRLGMHPPAQIHDALAASHRTMALDEGERGRDGGITGHHRRVGLADVQQREKPETGVVGSAEHVKRRRLAAPPGARELG